MTPESTSSPAAEAPRRGCFGCLLTSGLGCGAFGVGALGAVVLFAPSLLGGVLQRVLVSEWNQAVAGDVRLEALDLSWTSPVRLRGLEVDDPDGNLVVALDLTLPPLLTLLDDSAEKWDVTVDLRALELDLGEGGGTNLARALAPHPERGRLEPYFRFGPFDSRDGLEQSFEFTIAVDGPEARVRAGSALESPLELRTIHGGLEHRPGRTDFSLNAQIADAGGFRVEAGWGRAWWGGESVLKVEASQLPTVLADRILSTGGELAEALGPDLYCALSADQTRDGRVTLDLVGSEDRRLALDALVATDRLEVDGAGRLDGRCTLPRAWLAALLPAELPADLGVEAGRAAWDFRSSALVLPLRGLLGGGSLEPRGGIVLERDAALELVGYDGSDGPRTLHAVIAPRLTVAWSDDGVPLVDLVERDGDARLEELPAAGGGRRWRLVVPGLRTEVLARALGAAGLDALFGELVDLRFEGAAGEGRLDLKDPDGSTEVSGLLAGGILGSEDGDRAVLDLDLQNERHRAWLHTLLPWYAELRRVDGAPAPKLTFTYFELPLSGDLARLRGRGVLELHRVVCVLNPSFARRFASQEASEETFGKMTLEIDGDLIRYGDDLELAVGGEFYPFTGSHDLRQNLVFLSGEMAARYVSEAAPGVGDVIVKVTLHGPPDGLALTVDPQVYEAMNAGLSALLQFLGDDGE